MRGKQFIKQPYHNSYRITPADAGKTNLRRSVHADLGDHPRGCGENVFRDQLGKNLMGSPPRMRGKPAKALTNPIQCRDHPRGCGENPAATHGRTPARGSPPRMRGKLLFGGACGIRYGITPADAGKTSDCDYLEVICEDHPRGCGENHFASTIFCAISGSPPQVRGKRFQAEKQPQGSRITPAGAGKTVSR